MKLVLADTSSLIRMGIRFIFANNPEIQIVGEASSSEELFSILGSFSCDIVILDFTSQNFSIDDILNCKQNFTPKIIAITPDPENHTIVSAMKSGVSSYIKKDCSLQEIKECIVETNKGSHFFCGQILDKLRKSHTNLSDLDFEELSCDPILISERENQIIKLIAEGYTNTQIADMIHLSTHTINTHRKNILNKLGVKNTAGIVMYAVKTNLVKPNKFLFKGNN